MAAKKKPNVVALGALSAPGISKIECLDITPEQAAAMLEKENPTNRRRSTGFVERYAADMAAKKWVLTHQGIALGPDGTVMDGHHRLEACVRSGATFRTLVFTYESIDAFTRGLHAVDKGRGRSTGNVLELLGHVEVGKGGAVAALVAAMEALLTNEHRVMSVDETLLKYLQMRDSIEWAIESMPAKDNPAPIRAACAYAHSIYPEETREFVRLVTSKADLKAGSAAHKFVIHWANKKIAGDRVERYNAMLVTLRCIAGHIRKEKMLRVQASTDGIEFFRAAAARTKKAA